MTTNPNTDRPQHAEEFYDRTQSRDIVLAAGIIAINIVAFTGLAEVAAGKKVGQLAGNVVRQDFSDLPGTNQYYGSGEDR